MIIYLPGAKPCRVGDYVSTIDLGATILNIAGLEPANGSLGVSLLPFMNGESVDHPPVYGEQTNKQESPYVRPERNVHIETKKYMVITQSGFNSFMIEMFRRLNSTISKMIRQKATTSLIACPKERRSLRGYWDVTLTW
jgi:arylsulfatase A-like enzyme